MIARRIASRFLFNTFFEGDDPPPPPPAPGTNPPPPRTFTQDEVNRLVKADKDRAKKENETLLGQLRQIQEQGLTPEAKEELAGRIQQLEDEGKTKTQLAEEKYSKAEKTWKQKENEFTDKLTQSERRYLGYRTKTDINAAASSKDLLGENTAVNANQIVQILAPMVYSAPELGEDGKPTGDLVPRVKLNALDEKGKPTTLDLTVTEAVKRMSEMPDYGNLFHSGAKGGLGGNGSGNGSGRGNETVPENTAEFMKAWQKDKKQIMNSKN